MTGIDALLALRAAQAALALIIMSIFAAVVSLYNNSVGSTPSSVAFMVFVSVWTLLIVLPFTTAAPRFFPKLAHPYAMVAAESTTTIFYFCGFIAVANMVRTLDACRGSVCHSAIAGTIFGAFEFALFAASSYFAISHVLSRGSVNGGNGGVVGKDVESLRSNSQDHDRTAAAAAAAAAGDRLGIMMTKVRGLLGRQSREQY